MSKKRTINFRGRLKLFTALTLAGSFGAAAVALAQTASDPVVVPGNGTTTDLQTYQIQQVKIQYQKLLLKEKNIPSAISHINGRQIQQEGVIGSVQSVLRQTPSVNEYQSGPGQAVPVLTIRGVRLYELSETLDGNPMSDILSGGQGSFLSNNVGSPVTLDQLSDTDGKPGVTVYPGVAPPSVQGFGSGGGTIAYQTKDPAKNKSAEIFGSYGSFDTSDAGFELNTGDMTNSPEAPRALLRYDQGYTAGYTDNTNERWQDMLFKIEKPYDDGLSHLSTSVIYNRGFGYINTAPLPTALIDEYGYKYNFPKSLTATSEDNGYLTVNIHDDTYINEHLIVAGNLFYNRTTQTTLSYQNPSTIAYSPSFPYQVTFQVPYFSTGAIGPSADALGVATVANPTLSGRFTYDPLLFYPGGGVAGAVSSGAAQTSAAYGYGESAELIQSVTNTIGFSPSATIFEPFNTIKIGGLIAKENSDGTAGNGAGGGYEWIYGNTNVPQTSGNQTNYGGGSQRSVYQVYAQDQIDLLNDKLHLEPAVTIAAAYTSAIQDESFNYPAAKLQNFASIAEPYLGVSYDFPYHLIGYASYGKGGYFAPISDYGLNQENGVQSLTAPKPEIVHLYEAGLRYDTSTLYLNADYYYQKITSADSFFVNYSNGAQDEANDGSQEFKGWEADTAWKITPNLSWFGNASYTKATYLSSYFANDTPFEDQYGYVFKGDPLASVPNWLANFGLDWQKDNFGARFSEAYTGSQFITYDFQPQLTYTGPNITNNAGCSEGTNIPNECLGLATVPDSKNQGFLKSLIGGQIPLMKQPGYIVSNILLTYDLPLHHMAIQKLHFELNLQNILNNHYEEHLYSSYAEIPNGSGGYAITQAYTSAFYGPPRSITISVSAKF